MIHELAKQLRDAGFPNAKFEGSWTPTLSELIEACGEDKFLALELTCPSKGLWHASTKTHECDCRRCKRMLAENPEYLAVNWEIADGKTPEEAVAKLWLAINKK